MVVRAVMLLTSGFGAGSTACASDNEVVTIQSAIEQDLRDAVRIAEADLTVHVRDGHVTLSGTVNSVMDHRRASEIASRTIGVQSVANQIIIKPTQRKDSDILADVVMRLRVNDSVESPEIDAAVSRGQVTLTGKADSPAEKRIAEMAAGGVSGVREISNEISVRKWTDRTDADMRDEIAGLFVHSVYLDDVTPEVQVHDSVAMLSGNVGSAAQKDFARQLAEVRGIRRVDTSQLTIDPTLIDPTERRRRYADVSDAEITSAVEQSLRFDPVVFHSADDINVHVDNAAVMMTGRVPRLITKRKAERLAGDVIGVRRVVNDLEVEWPEEMPEDMAIISMVQDAVRRSPYLERRELRIHCQRGHVSLFGIVESEQEKMVAGGLAETVPGVVHVYNRLAVERRWKEKSDKEIQKDLERKLKFTLLKAAEEVDVTVEDGVAIIRGTVDTWRQWQTVMDLALEAGARHPHNLLNVRYHPAHGTRQQYFAY